MAYSQKHSVKSFFLGKSRCEDIFDPEFDRSKVNKDRINAFVTSKQYKVVSFSIENGIENIEFNIKPMMQIVLGSGNTMMGINQLIDSFFEKYFLEHTPGPLFLLIALLKISHEQRSSTTEPVKKIKGYYISDYFIARLLAFPRMMKWMEVNNLVLEHRAPRILYKDVVTVYTHARFVLETFIELATQDKLSRFTPNEDYPLGDSYYKIEEYSFEHIVVRSKNPWNFGYSAHNQTYVLQCQKKNVRYIVKLSSNECYVCESGKVLVSKFVDTGQSKTFENVVEANEFMSILAELCAAFPLKDKDSEDNVFESVIAEPKQLRKQLAKHIAQKYPLPQGAQARTIGPDSREFLQINSKGEITRSKAGELAPIHLATLKQPSFFRKHHDLDISLANAQEALRTLSYHLDPNTFISDLLPTLTFRGIQNLTRQAFIDILNQQPYVFSKIQQFMIHCRGFLSNLNPKQKDKFSVGSYALIPSFYQGYFKDDGKIKMYNIKFYLFEGGCDFANIEISIVEEDEFYFAIRLSEELSDTSTKYYLMLESCNSEYKAFFNIEKNPLSILTLCFTDSDDGEYPGFLSSEMFYYPSCEAYTRALTEIMPRAHQEWCCSSFRLFINCMNQIHFDFQKIMSNAHLIN